MSSPFTAYQGVFSGGAINIGSTDITASPTATGTQAIGATTLVLSSTTGISVGWLMSGTPSIDILASVLSVVDSTHVTISEPLLGPISGGTTINFYTFVTTGGIVTTEPGSCDDGAFGGADACRQKWPACPGGKPGAVAVIYDSLRRQSVAGCKFGFGRADGAGLGFQRQPDLSRRYRCGRQQRGGQRAVHQFNYLGEV